MGGAFSLTVVLMLLILYRHVYSGNPRTPFTMVADCYKVLAVLVALLFFGYFLKLKMPQSKIINRIAASSFAVLLIHANSDDMRQWLWKDFLNVKSYFDSQYFVVYYIVTVLSIYLLCTIVDQFRIAFIEEPLFNILDKNRRLSNILNRNI